MFNRIVAGVSRADTAKSVGRQAVELANILGSELHLVGCYDPEESTKSMPLDQHLQSSLDAVALSAKGPVVTHVLPGDPADVILEVAKTSEADLIVVGNKGMQGAHRLLGSVGKFVSQHAGCAVLILATT